MSEPIVGYLSRLEGLFLLHLIMKKPPIKNQKNQFHSFVGIDAKSHTTEMPCRGLSLRGSEEDF